MATKHENNLHVTIPSYFKCPISLELMKSPVSLSTGITYDRSSIQSWLDNGNTTCPATMQSLSSPSLVPNLTLHRLIHLWSRSHPLSPRSPSLSLCLSLSLSSLDITESLRRIYDRVGNSDRNKKVLDESEEFLESLIELMVKSDEVCDLELIVMVLEVCSEMKIRKLVIPKMYRCFEKFVIVLRNGSSLESKIAVSRIVSVVSNQNNEVKRSLIETNGLVKELCKVVESEVDGVIEAGLNALIAVASTKAVKNEMVKLGIVRRLREILCDVRRVEEKVLIQKTMEMVEVMATCAEGRTAICEDEECVGEVVRRLMKVSEKATEHGVTVLWSVCYLFRDDKAKEIVERSNGLGKCLLLLQSNCKPIVKQMCRDLVKVLRVDYNNKSCLGGYDSKTTHITPY